MSGNIDRIMAQKDMRSLTVANSAQSGEGAQQCRERLNAETGEIVKVAFRPLEAKRDEKGFAELKAMANK
jgi:hypothetical protein